MSASTKIEWATKSWNPVRGCTRVSEGCRNCYAERQAVRQSAPGKAYDGLVRSSPTGPRWTGVVRFVPEALDEPLRWRKPQRIFVNSMSDLFHEGLPDEAIDRVLAVMMLAPRHTFKVLTKRPQRMRDYFRAPDLYRRILAVADHELRPVRRQLGGIGISNPADAAFRRWIWLGVSVEDQATADARIPLLLETPAAVRWVSYEPALGPLTLNPWLLSEHGLSWVVVGGESGPRARPMDIAWPREIVEQCKSALVPVFVKQMGKWLAGSDDGFGCPSRWLLADGRVFVPPVIGAGRRARPENAVAFSLDGQKGGVPEYWPEHLRVRQFPGGAR